MLAIEWLELSIFALLARRSKRLSHLALKLLFLAFVFEQYQIKQWLQEILATQRFALSILAMLARRSNRLSDMALQLALFWVLVFAQY